MDAELYQNFSFFISSNYIQGACLHSSTTDKTVVSIFMHSCIQLPRYPLSALSLSLAHTQFSQVIDSNVSSLFSGCSLIQIIPGWMLLRTRSFFLCTFTNPDTISNSVVFFTSSLIKLLSGAWVPSLDLHLMTTIRHYPVQ